MSTPEISQFTWVPAYKEIAAKLLDWEDRQHELIQFLIDLREKGLKVTSMNDRDKNGNVIPLQEIDPFTVMGSFNRDVRNENRIEIIKQFKDLFGLTNPIPTDLNGIPTLNNQSSWFFSYLPNRRHSDIPTLWKIFRLALGDNPLANKEFQKTFDDAMEIRKVATNLTMGLFWIRPDTFASLDAHMRSILKVKLPPEGMNSTFYLDCLQKLRAKNVPFWKISYQAWIDEPEDKIEPGPINSDVQYWLLGSYWKDRDDADQSERFMEEGIWENGFGEKYDNLIKSVKVGDKVAIHRYNSISKKLPFDAKGNSVSSMTIYGCGTVVANRGEGNTLEIEYDTDFDKKTWYFYTLMNPVWKLNTSPGYRLIQNVKNLISFIWHDQKQDYLWYCKEWFGEKNPSPGDSEENPLLERFYPLENLLSSGVFIDENEIRQSLERLKTKKNLILQGPPGVGKTFIARKLAYALMEEAAPERVEMIQFHQSFSYEDFIRGYRPSPNEAGKFHLQDAVFFRFCEKARKDPDHDYVFIIDEINRGNLSQIFGELLMLIEADKRGPEFEVQLVYQKPDEERFHVPANIHIIGLMNIADRSLAIVDYALRRRFAFMTLKPQFGTERFKRWFSDRKMQPEVIELINQRMLKLNQEIANDPHLGESFCVGHSFFCPRAEHFEKLGKSWFEAIIDTEIIPLIREYWFDNPEKVMKIIQMLKSETGLAE